jgi:hypothetical protein
MKRRETQPLILSFLIILVLSGVTVRSQSKISVAQQSDTSWTELTSARGGFTVQIPGNPTESTQNVESISGKIPHRQYTVVLSEAAFLVTYADIPVPINNSRQVTAVLDAARDCFLKETDGTLLTEHEVNIEGYIGREFVIEKPECLIIDRTLLVNQRLYQLVVYLLHKAGSPMSDQELLNSSRFLNSFKLTSSQLRFPSKPSRLISFRKRG